MLLACMGVAAIATPMLPASALEEEASARGGPRLLGNGRLRYETVNDSLNPKDATALTVRYRGAIEVPLGQRLTFLGEVEGNEDLIARFNDGRENWTNRLDRPFILDPDGRELNRLQLQAEFAPGKLLTIGRQRIVLDDERFLGVSAFRQNDRTFDAVRLGADLGGTVLLDAAYLRRTQRVLGDDSPFGSFVGDSLALNLNLPSPAGRLSLFHYALDLRTGPAQERTDKASSQTTGIRVTGRRYWQGHGLRWELSYATQRDFADNPKRYRADYGLLSATYERARFSATLRGEVLGGSEEGVGFQTPLATLRKFQGNADVFFNTPGDGVRDLSLEVQWRFQPTVPLVDEVQVFARQHGFWAERGGQRYGTELDLGMTARRGRTSVSAGLAAYRADTFAGDVDRIFFSLSRIF